MREIGHAAVRARGHTKLLDGIEDTRTPEGRGLLNVWMSHGDKVTELPPGFSVMASTAACPVAAMADEARRFYGVQLRDLLRVIVEQEPGSLDELARITGKAKSNLSRTLKTMAGYGLVRLERGERGRITPKVTHDRVELDLQLSLSRKAG